MKIIGVSGKFAVFKYTVFSLLFACACLLIAVYSGKVKSLLPDYESAGAALTEESLNETVEKETETVPEETKELRLIMIDAGHGGEDGGAVSESGVLEKDLNLTFSDNIAHLCLMFGVPYKMTREDDSLLYDKYGEFTDYSGKKKSLDLKNRLKYTAESNASLLLSVHMNKFSDSSVSGLQVYYSKSTDDGESLATAIHSYVSEHIQLSNKRKAKVADSSIYLLHNSKITSILVEFGFLSSNQECDLLCNASYRSSLSTTVFIPVLEYFVRT